MEYHRDPMIKRFPFNWTLCNFRNICGMLRENGEFPISVDTYVSATFTLPVSLNIAGPKRLLHEAGSEIEQEVQGPATRCGPTAGRRLAFSVIPQNVQRLEHMYGSCEKPERAPEKACTKYGRSLYDHFLMTRVPMCSR